MTTLRRRHVPTPKAREKALSAYAEILREEGERAATIDAVAARAGVSKGGVLYHFATKEALGEALLEWFDDVATKGLEEMAADPEGPARHYVRTSWITSEQDDDPVYRAVLRLAQASWQPAIDAIEGIHQAWGTLVREEVGDDSVADAILLIGEGLYYHSAMPSTWSGGSFDHSVEDLLAVVDRLKEL
ncbi:TetR/AcrR family transcriptional regulator [Nocardioides alcanivorans]|uniref:TetR/AcrR family transcriptional regulator n=1 Tax=Nocardioides alcanivorans TaxID=2897352 RepID=UPI001F3413A1|nr:TetR/AcrR family transcriptional regulator [Nocardioides alcanivorans]